jgi:hypothetical protein
MQVINNSTDIYGAPVIEKLGQLQKPLFFYVKPERANWLFSPFLALGKKGIVSLRWL